MKNSITLVLVSIVLWGCPSIASTVVGSSLNIQKVYTFNTEPESESDEESEDDSNEESEDIEYEWPG